jgi:hypothetical protein
MHLGEPPGTRGRRLGVKGSQVHILSARQGESAGQGPFRRNPEGPLTASWGDVTTHWSTLTCPGRRPTGQVLAEVVGRDVPEDASVDRASGWPETAVCGFEQEIHGAETRRTGSPPGSSCAAVAFAEAASRPRRSGAVDPMSKGQDRAAALLAASSTFCGSCVSLDLASCAVISRTCISSLDAASAAG